MQATSDARKQRKYVRSLLQGVEGVRVAFCVGGCAVLC
jgi:hypothetical protein